MKYLSIDRRKDILHAATNSFAMFGYKATTMDQVAKLANVGKGTIYTFFKTKEELFDEIIQTLITDMRNAAESVLQQANSFQENLHQAIFKMLEFRREHQLTIKLFQEEQDMGTPEVHDGVKRLEQTILTFIQEKVENAIKKKVIKPCNPEITAFILLKMYIALIFDWEKNHPALTEDHIASYIEMYILHGLST